MFNKPLLQFITLLFNYEKKICFEVLRYSLLCFHAQDILLIKCVDTVLTNLYCSYYMFVNRCSDKGIYNRKKLFVLFCFVCYDC